MSTRKILVTGGASGLGLAITRELASSFSDSTIYFTFHASGEQAKELESEFKNVKGIACDFSDAKEIDELCSMIGSTEFDILVNNAITKLDKQYFHKMELDEIQKRFHDDILSTLSITKAFILSARKRKSGRIITILTSSLEGVPPIGWSVYMANKSYLLAMHRSWVVENKAYNITSNCVSPGFMQTPLHGEMDERVIENMIAAHPRKQLLTPGEVAGKVSYLCETGTTVNGENLIIE